MLNNFDRRVLGYFETSADMVAAKAGMNQVAVCFCNTAIDDEEGGTFAFRRFTVEAPSPDGLNIFAATGAGGGTGFWIRIGPFLTSP